MPSRVLSQPAGCALVKSEAAASGRRQLEPLSQSQLAAPFGSGPTRRAHSLSPLWRCAVRTARKRLQRNPEQAYAASARACHMAGAAPYATAPRTDRLVWRRIQASHAARTVRVAMIGVASARGKQIIWLASWPTARLRYVKTLDRAASCQPAAHIHIISLTFFSAGQKGRTCPFGKKILCIGRGGAAPSALKRYHFRRQDRYKQYKVFYLK